MARIDGTDGNDLLIGNPEADQIYGKGDIDLLRGAGGDDRIFGGGGPDSLYGDQGADYINGGGGNDLIRGGKGNDTLGGWGGQDVIRGDLGDDLIFGFGDGDYIDGGPGYDTVDYGQMTDGGEGYRLSVNTVHLHPDITTPMRYVEAQDLRQHHIDLLVDVEAIRGSAYADWIRVGLYRESEIEEIDGAGGDDLLLGYGATRILGGAGNDTVGVGGADGAVLTGGPGADTFTFAGDTTAATITDFVPGEDLIQLYPDHFGTVPEGGLQAMLDGSTGDTLNLELLGVADKDHGTLTLSGVNVADLTVDDFLLE